MEEEFENFDEESVIGDCDDGIDMSTSTDDDSSLYTVTDEDNQTNGHKDISFGGHTSGKCNLCGCTHFRRSSDEKYCLCGHSDYDHEWI